MESYQSSIKINGTMKEVQIVEQPQRIKVEAPDSSFYLPFIVASVVILVLTIFLIVLYKLIK